MTLKEFIIENSKRLKNNNVDSPRLDVELFVCDVCYIDRAHLLTQWDRSLTDSEFHQLNSAIERRVHGESVAYILGYKHFYKYRFNVDSRVLVPRPETELMVEKILHWVDNKSYPYRILDMGTGSGCIGLSLAKELTNSRLTAVDISVEALEVFKENMESLQLSDRVTMIHSDVVNLAQISRSVPTATTGPLAVPGRTPSTGFDRLSGMLSTPFRPRSLAHQSFSTLVTKTCERREQLPLNVTTRPPVTARPLDERRGTDEERLEAYLRYVEGKRRGRQQSLSPRGEQLQSFYDIVVANPPYIAPEDPDVCRNVVEYEPHIALFTERGLEAPIAWMKQVPYLLKHQGAVFMMEFGLGQGDELKKQLENLQVFDRVQLIPDYTCRNRFLYGTR